MGKRGGAAKKGLRRGDVLLVDRKSGQEGGGERGEKVSFLLKHT